MPTSKRLRIWLDKTQPQQWILDLDGRNLDPLHGKTTHLRVTVEALTTMVSTCENNSNSYLKLWRATETQVRQKLDQTMGEIDWLFEGKAAWLLSKTLPPERHCLLAVVCPFGMSSSFGLLEILQSISSLIGARMELMVASLPHWELLITSKAALC